MTDPMNFLKDVDVRLSAELGATTMPLQDVMDLREESVVPLERLTDELIDISVNGRRIARGEVITENGRFAIRIMEMEGQQARHKATAEAVEAPGA
ncbi:flagellar motor switch protein FliN [Croceicoccus gelatinilyticus]|uniref:flagellar motor switch protein FliN n=1 Tax=Croceicoccus gelatinilyticus TaxID=2835536 RepID=UPI001BCAE247|nr:flagellar motor switch protein FliN [Croceicoccus gelatinilyticus]MBS7671338.1 flagellar motor switch protein FliN [Croceicoccus gelatinilyticus]